MTSGAPDAKPQAFGRYRVTKTLGAGAMGEVYEALDDLLGREVAIKTLRGSSGLAARFIDERFRNEARAIAQLAHPGAVQVFDIDLSADPPYLVMERVAGPSLSGRLQHGPLAAEEVVPLGIQIARALAAAHSANVIHRDVKPSNILGAGPGVWKLADFGVAHVPDSSLTMTGQFVGSPAYAAPEALIKGVSNAAGDVYGLGATLYEAATGTWPRFETSGALLAPVPPIATRAPNLPPHVAAAIDRAVALEAAQRPTASELADLLASAATSTGATAPAHGAMTMPTVSTPGHRPARWQPWAVGGAVVLAIMLAIAMCGDKQPSALPGAARPSLPGGASETPQQYKFDLPASVERKQARDWQKLRADLEAGEFASALGRLDKLERKFGETPESQRLRKQLEQMPREIYERNED